MPRPRTITGYTANDTPNDIDPAIKAGGSITLNASQLNELGLILGGKSFKTPEDIIKAFRDIFSIQVGDVTCQLDVEDLYAFRDQYASFSHYPYPEYVSLSIQEAVSQYLWGSTKGILV